MTKGSTRRHARAERTRCVAIAARFLKASKYTEAIGPLLEAVRLDPSDAGALNDLGLAYLFTGRVPDAIAWLRRSVASHPSSGGAHYNLGVALQQAGDDEAAILALREAVTLSPEHTEAHARLADLLFMNGRLRDAASAYEEAYASAPGTTLGRLSRAMTLDTQDRPQDAEEELRQLISCDASESRAYDLLGRILQEAGRFDEAVEIFERSIEIAPWEAVAYYGLASSKRFTEADRPWIARILSRLQAEDGPRLFSPAVAQCKQMTLHFAAGKVLDDLGEYADAMKHFNAANGIRRQLHPFDRDKVEQNVDRIIALFAPKFLADYSAIGCNDSTPILIVGMPRSGTTLLERVVSSHPEVRGCGELDFWNVCGPGLVNAEPGRLVAAADRICGDYVRMLRRRAPDVLRATDKMPFNFLWVGLVHLLFPNAKIVHSRRNPVDTCLSIYTTHVGRTWGFASTLGDLASYYRLYSRLMAHWRAVIPSDRLLEVDYEDVVAEPERTARRLLAFCELEWDPTCLRPETNPAVVKTASNWQTRQPIYGTSVERWRCYEQWIAELRELL
jgi:tetratricopeptide (TPR) repeat protein